MPLNRNNVWENIGYWLAEIIVVFIGVYLAFLLNGYRIQRQQKHKKQQIYAALYHYFSTLNIERSKNEFENYYITSFLKPYKKKEMPRLKKSPRFITFSINDHAWNAMLQAGGIDLLDVQLIMQINYFFNSVQRFHEIITHFNKMSDKYLLSNYNADISHFYSTDTKKLKAQYDWYINYIKFTKGMNQTLIGEVDAILKILKQKMDKKQLDKAAHNSTK